MSTEPVIPPPLDAYFTAKPGEPTWAVQGGDPLGGPLLRLWAHFARIRANAYPGRGLEGIFEQILKAATSSLPDSEHERTELLVRATATEEISWNMDTYYRGQIAVEKANTPAKKSAAEIDQFDRRVNAVRRLNNAVSEIEEIINQLGGTGDQFLDEDQCADLIDLSDQLQAWSKQIEPRRLMKQS